MTHLERFNQLKAKHPAGDYLVHDFVGWMCGTADRAENDASYRPSVLAELERFLASYEAEIIVGRSDATPNQP